MIKVVRILFLFLMALVAVSYIVASQSFTAWFLTLAAVTAAFAVIALDILFRKKNLSALSGVFFGLLVGILVSMGIGYLIEQAVRILLPEATQESISGLKDGTKLLISLMICYI